MAQSRLLIVDDDPEAASALQSVLKCLGYEVSGTAASGEDAVRLAENLLPDLILMDVELGGKMDGTEAAEIIHNRLQVPIVFLTAHSDEKVRSRAQKSEPFGYLLKPYHPEDLRVTIETALDKIRLESRLKASREQYRRLVEDCNYVFLTVSREGVFTYASPAVEQLSGYSYQELVGRPVVELLPSPEKIRVKRAIKGKCRKEIGEDEYRFHHRQGGLRWVRISWHPIGEEEETGSWSVMAVDITARKQAELRAERRYRDIAFLSRAAMEFIRTPPEGDIFGLIGELLRDLLGKILIGVNSFDPETRSLCTRALVGLDPKLRGLMEDDPAKLAYLLTEEAYRVLLTGRLQEVPGGVYEVGLGRIPRKLADRLEKRLGIRHIYSIGFGWEGVLHGNATILLPGGRDLDREDREVIETFIQQAAITLQRQRAEGKLRESEEMYRAIFQSANDIILFIDREGRIVDVNEKLEKLGGYPREELVGKKFSELTEIFHPDDLPVVAENFRRRIKGVIEPAYEVRVFKKNREPAILEINAAPIEKDGKIVGDLAILRDITARKKAQAGLEAATESLRIQKEDLERKTAALQEVLQYIEGEKQEIKERVAINVEKVFLPLLRGAKTRGDTVKTDDLGLLEKLLQDLSSSFGREVADPRKNLTPREIEICALIKGGLRTKDIAERLHLSPKTVSNHRDKIREKLGLKDRGANLVSFIQGLS